jgi:3-isopropylmalate/(R)-2-methylmalate dehydratase small subunit
MVLKGRAWKYGKNIDTDVIIPGRYANIAEARELAEHCLEDLDPDFVKNMEAGDVIVAETNFGCGSSREIAPLSIKAAGVSCVIAESFARIFYRNAINIGLPIFECPEAVDGSETGDEIEVDTDRGRIINLTKNQSFQTERLPDFIREIIVEGGLMKYVSKKLSNL